MNLLDIIVIAAIGLSALFAFVRGFVKEALSIAAWAGAALVTLYGLPAAKPYAMRLVSSPMLASIIAGLALFIVSLIVLSLVTSAIARRVKQSSLSAVDRALGLLFGLVRGVVIVCLAFMALNAAIAEPDWPDWIRAARTRPFLSSGAEFLRDLVPAQARAEGAATAATAERGIEQAREAQQLMEQFAKPAVSPAGKPPANAAAGYNPGYNQNERRDMQRLIDGAQ